MTFSVTLYRDDVLCNHEPIEREGVVEMERVQGDVAGDGRDLKLTFADGSTEFTDPYLQISEVEADDRVEQAYAVLEDLRAEFREHGMDSEAGVINEAHYLLQEHRGAFEL